MNQEARDERFSMIKTRVSGAKGGGYTHPGKICGQIGLKLTR